MSSLTPALYHGPRRITGRRTGSRWRDGRRRQRRTRRDYRPRGADREKYEKRVDIGNDSGYFYPKRPDGIFKRTIRGMLPHKKQRGREAFESVRVYVGNPYDEDGEVLDGTSLDRLSNIKFIALGEFRETGC